MFTGEGPRMRTLWRLHIRPGGGRANPAFSVAHCLDRSIIGMGWGVPNEPTKQSTDMEWYKTAAIRAYGEDRSWYSVWTFAEQPAIGDLVWFRNTEGRFYMAEILSPWRYQYEDTAAIDADIVNFREARIMEVGVADAVPGKIIACFRPSRTFQAIRSPSMLAYSEKLAGLPTKGDDKTDLYEFMDDADLENVVFVYLQVLGWYVLPGTRTTTAAHHEFVLVDRETGSRAVVQVKSGDTAIDASRYPGEEKAFLFAASNNYGRNVPSNAVIITKQQLNEFMRTNSHLLSRAVSTWIKIAGLP